MRVWVRKADIKAWRESRCDATGRSSSCPIAAALFRRTGKHWSVGKDMAFSPFINADNTGPEIWRLTPDARAFIRAADSRGHRPLPSPRYIRIW